MNHKSKVRQIVISRIIESKLFDPSHQPMAVEDEIDLTWMTSDARDLEVNMSLDEKDKEPMTGEVKILCEMGFSQSMARKALDRTRWDVEAAAEWCIAHIGEEIGIENKGYLKKNHH